MSRIKLDKKTEFQANDMAAGGRESGIWRFPGSRFRRPGLSQWLGLAASETGQLRVTGYRRPDAAAAMRRSRTQCRSRGGQNLHLPLQLPQGRTRLRRFPGDSPRRPGLSQRLELAASETGQLPSDWLQAD